MSDGFWAAVAAERTASCTEMRDRGRVVEIDGCYHLTHRDDVLGALANPEVFSSAPPRDAAPFSTGAAFDLIGLPQVPVGIDPPEHATYQKLLKPLFGNAAVAEAVPEMTRQARSLIDAVAADGGCEAMSAVVAPYVIHNMQTFFGLPVEDGYMIGHLKDAITVAEPGTASHMEPAFVLFAYLSHVISERRGNPGMAGLLAKLTADLSDAEAIAASWTMISGSVGNEAHLIGRSLLALASDPHLLNVLANDLGQVDRFVEEMTRLHLPNGQASRFAARDVTIGDVTIPEGSMVKLHIASANREDTDGITIDDGQIKPCRHWSYGHGVHRCPGAKFVRAEAGILISEWLTRIPEFQVSFECPEIFAFHSKPLTRLPLRWATLGTAPAV